MQRLDPSKLPRHVAIIMDGNGRWARRRFMNRISGHEAGAESVREVVRCCRELEIPYLTLYAFSKENWQRPQSEVSALWHLLKRFIRAELPELIDKEIRLVHLGDIDGIPPEVANEFLAAVERTAGFNRLTVNLALNYGGRHEIVRAAKRFAQDVEVGKFTAGELTPELFADYLFTRGVPDPDLLIRTSGECRISNFLLWQLAYTEIYISDVLWPDFRRSQFIDALLDYQGRERRFGKVSEQVQV